MEMFLFGLAMSMLGVAVSAALFAAATRDERVEPARPAEMPAAEASRFFAAATASPSPVVPGAPGEPDPLPVDALILQIERHIRLEQAAAESFRHAPTGQSLHRRTTSPLVN